jgi:hypothetical protein
MGRVEPLTPEQGAEAAGGGALRRLGEHLSLAGRRELAAGDMIGQADIMKRR